ncbi:hypothetical protein [Bradyrhizobium stylosanthis]|uniref:hypothetical protein n=1 Tax=Bradyrhizobium stylosanthis TaxID=1803665 RepID=UPI0011A12A76|nr:hypothetical protein [Bradyrhizobium stylosanthis]
MATKRAEILEPGDDFCPKTIDAIMSRKEVQDALEKRVRSNFSDNRDLYTRLPNSCRRSPIRWRSLRFDVVDGKPIDEVLRRMRVAPATARRALIATAIEPANGSSDELVERIASRPEITADLYVNTSSDDLKQASYHCINKVTRPISPVITGKTRQSCEAALLTTRRSRNTLSGLRHLTRLRKPGRSLGVDDNERNQERSEAEANEISALHMQIRAGTFISC